ncbi:MAG TPA: DinB family protein, partial [Anaerolineae bacterium]|nr:DinB family protein [Anaerolineae bacterium]
DQECRGETMNRPMIELLIAQTDEAWESLHRRLQGLTDEEFFWEPVPDCWTVHLNAAGHWIEDYADPAPEPPPFTTIAWKLIHLAACKVMYYEYAFGPRQLIWDELAVPHTAAESIGWLQESHTRLRQELNQHSEADLTEPRLTNWGELWPTWKIFWAMIQHDLHHGAEIGCLRDLYLWKSGKAEYQFRSSSPAR